MGQIECPTSLILISHNGSLPAVKGTLQTLEVYREGFPFRSRSTLAVKMPDIAYPCGQSTITPLELILMDAFSIRYLINGNYTLEISSEDFKEVEELRLIRWEKETRPLFKIK